MNVGEIKQLLQNIDDEREIIVRLGTLDAVVEIEQVINNTDCVELIMGRWKTIERGKVPVDFNT